MGQRAQRVPPQEPCNGWRLLVDRQDFGRTLQRPVVLPEEAAPGELHLAVERLALSANTLTYASMGDSLGFWSLYPPDEADAAAGWAQVPAWGHARVLASGLPGVAPGSRWFGLWPLASVLRLQVMPARQGLRAVGPARAGLNPVYQQYREAPTGDEAALAAQACWQPLFITSFALAQRLALELAPGTSVILVSAASKTALGLAHLMGGRTRLLGLSSARNTAWLREMALFERLVSYEAMPELADTAGPVLVVDFSGNAALLGRLLQTLAPRCQRLLCVGSTHGGEVGAAAQGLRVPTEVFSGPRQIQALVADWGAGEFDQRLQEALGWWTEVQRPWFEYRHLDGRDAIAAGWLRLQRNEWPASSLLVARPGS
ncbi:DUF2855 family protein [Ideonella azotifigens]|uniref:DUF2855 family protein n=1 Tax=Ideonella azotifigens TaxID=513160 RepID=A0ABP3VEI9_9BURK|nr:DUF2855 family protein [Ideonella azotifigens]MCD2344594.1 DUF2855 family protein [Ideonella azotifigens]